VVAVDPNEQLRQEEAAIEKQQHEMQAETDANVAEELKQAHEVVETAIQEQIQQDIAEDTAKEMDEIEQMRAEMEFVGTTSSQQAAVQPPIVSEEVPKKSEESVEKDDTAGAKISSPEESKEDDKKEEATIDAAEVPKEAPDDSPVPAVAVKEQEHDVSTLDEQSHEAVLDDNAKKDEPTTVAEELDEVKNQGYDASTQGGLTNEVAKTDSSKKEDSLNAVEELSKEVSGESTNLAQDDKEEETVECTEIASKVNSTSPEVQIDTSTSKLIVLITTQSFGNPTQRANQDRAMAMITSKFGDNNELVEIVDGTDPSNKERRNELFGISGIRAKYPQFFVRRDGATIFMGDYEWIEGANETESLTSKALLGVDVPTKQDRCAGSAPVRVEREADVDIEPVASEFQGNDAPAAASPGYPKIILLVSKSSGSLQQRTNQDRALSMLKGKVSADNDLDEVDGSDPANKDRRDALFAISGIRAQYPQFFLQKNENDVLFLGDFDWLDYLNETGGLTKAALFGEREPARNASDGSVVKNEPSTTVSSEATEQKDEEKPPRPQLIVLISKSSGVLRQRTNQDQAMGMLKGKFQPDDMEIVDGSDWANTELRNNLFEISGIRGDYPQFFYKNKEGTDLTFLGNFEWIENANETGQLSKAAVFDSTVEVVKNHKEEPFIEEVAAPFHEKVATSKRSDETISEAPKAVAKEPHMASTLFDQSTETLSGSNRMAAKAATTSTPEIDSTSSFPALTPVVKAKPPPARSASSTASTQPTEINGKRMILLISSFGGGVKQKANQFRAKNILQSGKPGSKIVPEEIDAANPFHKELISTLTIVSGVSDKFPQVFLKDTVLGTYTYVGGVATLETHHKNGDMVSIFGGDSARENAAKGATNQAVPTTEPAPTSTTRGVDSPKRRVDLPEHVGDDDALPLLHIAVAVLGVAVGIGMWFSTRREMPR
jgi:hypothetical protein